MSHVSASLNLPSPLPWGRARGRAWTELWDVGRKTIREQLLEDVKVQPYLLLTGWEGCRALTDAEGALSHCLPLRFLKVVFKEVSGFCPLLDLADHTQFNGKINKFYSFLEPLPFCRCGKARALVGKGAWRDMLWPPMRLVPATSEFECPMILVLLMARLHFYFSLKIVFRIKQH